jgi:hypothetical protein
MKIEKLSIIEKKITKTAKLDKYVELMKKYGHLNGYDMLPQNTWHEVSFNMVDTHTGFAHGISRILTEELETKCASVDEKNVLTDDKFISDMVDGLIKNINLLPLNQSLSLEELNNYSIYLYKYNNTNEIIEVKAGDFIVTNGKKQYKKGRGETSEPIEEIEIDYSEKEEVKEEPQHKKSNTSISNIFPYTNIIITRLRPGRYIKIKELDFEVGQSKNNAAKFSLLNNVTYYPTDIEPYSIFTGKGTRSINHESKEFYLSFSTAGNITPLEVMKNCHFRLNSDLKSIREKIDKYSKSDLEKKFYTDEGIDVTNRDEILYYRLPGQYFTTVNMIAQRCYILDPTILLCTSGVERFDTQVGLIKLKHADANNLLLSAIDGCINDMDKLLEYFEKKM